MPKRSLSLYASFGELSIEKTLIKLTIIIGKAISTAIREALVLFVTAHLINNTLSISAVPTIGVSLHSAAERIPHI